MEHSFGKFTTPFTPLFTLSVSSSLMLGQINTKNNFYVNGKLESPSLPVRAPSQIHRLSPFSVQIEITLYNVLLNFYSRLQFIYI